MSILWDDFYLDCELPSNLCEAALLACVTELQEGVKQKCKITLSKKVSLVIRTSGIPGFLVRPGQKWT